MSKAHSLTLEDWKDTAIRAAKTAVQVFVGSVSVSALMSLDWTVWRAGALSASSSAVAIIWNAVLKWSTDTD